MRKRVKIVMGLENTIIKGSIEDEDLNDLISTYEKWLGEDLMYDVKFKEYEHCYINIYFIRAIIID